MLKIFKQDDPTSEFKMSWWEAHTVIIPDSRWRKFLRRLPILKHKLKDRSATSAWEHRSMTVKCKEPLGVGWSFSKGKTVYVDDVSIIETPDISQEIR